MNKFKIGDEVEIILPSTQDRKIGIISGFGKIFNYYVTFRDGFMWAYDVQELKLSENHIFNNSFEEHLQ